MTIGEIPLDPSPQVFQIALGDKQFQVSVDWNNYSNSWSMSIADAAGVPIISSIPLVTGADLLEQVEYLNIGGKLTTQVEGNPFEIPTFENLGISSHVYFGS